MKQIMKKEYSLDYNIERDVDRLAAVEKILDNLKKQPTAADLETMASYILYGKDENGKIDFSRLLSSEEYKSLYQKEIDIFNESINKTRIIVDMIDRFIVRGRNSDYDIDALVCGTVDDYVWLMNHDIYDLILSRRCLDYTSPHVACLTIGPKKRNLDGHSKNVKDRYIVCIRWNFIKENIIEFKNEKS